MPRQMTATQVLVAAYGLDEDAAKSHLADGTFSTEELKTAAEYVGAEIVDDASATPVREEQITAAGCEGEEDLAELEARRRLSGNS